MAYSPLIYPSPQRLEKLRLYLLQEISNHHSERSPWVDNLKRWDNLYWAEPSAAASQGPLKFGATVVIPVIAIALEMMQAKAISKMFALDQFITTLLPDEYDHLDKSLETLLDHELLVTANMREAVEEATLNFHKYGTGILKVGYEYLTRKGIFYNSMDEEYEQEVVVRKGVCVDSVQASNYLMPFYAKDAAVAPWCGEVHHSTEFEIQGFVSSGLFYNDAYDKLKAYFSLGNTVSAPSNVFETNRDVKENRIPVWPRSIDWEELKMSFDIDGDGKDEELFVYYYSPADIILGIRYNDRHDLSRGYHKGAFFPVEGRWPGIGLAKMGEQFQIEITTQHRQRLDASALANLRMFKAKKGSSISPDEPIFYGKIWMVDEMNDLEMFQIGEVYPSAYQNEQATNLWWQQRSGVNEISLGMPHQGTPGTAAGDLARVQEGSARYDYAYSRMKAMVKSAVLDAVCIIGKYGVRHESIYTYLQYGEEVRQFLGMSPDMIKNEIILKLDIAGQSQNKLLDRASWTQLSGMLQQYFTANIQIATQLGDQELVQKVVRKAMSASTEAMKQILEAFDRRNLDKLVLTQEEIGDAIQQQNPELYRGVGGLTQPPGLGYVNPVSIMPGG